MKFKSMKDKSLDEIRYNPYTEGTQKNIIKGEHNDIKRAIGVTSIINALISKGKQKEALRTLKEKNIDKEYSASEVFSEMLAKANEEVTSSKESFDGITLG